MPNFYTIGNRIINLDHVISAEFTPATPAGEDDGEGKPYGPLPARLTVTTTEMYVNREFTYDGDLSSAASASRDYEFKGEKAERFWRDLQTLTEETHIALVLQQDEAA